jgi:4'-phosphopantetheinyl transferase
MGAISSAGSAERANAKSAWAPGPVQPQLAAGVLHVWRADLETVDDRLEQLLSPEELERAGRMLRAAERCLWARSRGVLRSLLGRYLQSDPATLRFLIGTQGKPVLLLGAGELGEGELGDASAAGAPSPPLSFNLSHSAESVLVAITATGQIGVDVEFARRPIDELALAARALGADEARRLESLDPATRRREFLKAWTRHEARLKCLGTGIGGRATHSFEPWLAELDMGPTGAGAVAVEHPARELRCWEWR